MLGLAGLFLSPPSPRRPEDRQRSSNHGTINSEMIQQLPDGSPPIPGGNSNQIFPPGGSPTHPGGNGFLSDDVPCHSIGRNLQFSGLVDQSVLNGKIGVLDAGALEQFQSVDVGIGQFGPLS